MGAFSKRDLILVGGWKGQRNGINSEDCGDLPSAPIARPFKSVADRFIC